jgi:hypothetical protein
MPKGMRFRIENSSTQKSTFDHNVYKMLKGWVVVGKDAIRFSVRIPCFQRFLRATLVILDQEGLRVKINDADFDAKI